MVAQSAKTPNLVTLIITYIVMYVYFAFHNLGKFTTVTLSQGKATKHNFTYNLSVKLDRLSTKTFLLLFKTTTQLAQLDSAMLIA